MTLPLARDLGQLGIRVMCICPGTMDTPLLAGLSREFIDRLAENNVFPKRVGVPPMWRASSRKSWRTRTSTARSFASTPVLRLAPR
jgi:3-hydroxyacyl-CoA dehydrogenase/3-hydroxy-2-methylbutyryl-CoA dehydrogenase